MLSFLDKNCKCASFGSGTAPGVKISDRGSDFNLSARALASKTFHAIGNCFAASKFARFFLPCCVYVNYGALSGWNVMYVLYWLNPSTFGGVDNIVNAIRKQAVSHAAKQSCYSLSHLLSVPWNQIQVWKLVFESKINILPC